MEQFSWELRHPPNPQHVAFVLEGLRFGFKLGFSPSQSLKPAKRNKPSAYEHPSVIDEYLATEVSLGRVAGPFASPPVPLLHVSSFGVIPKKGQPGKWGLIVDLSSPGGARVNDGINPDEFALHYTTAQHIPGVFNQIADALSRFRWQEFRQLAPGAQPTPTPIPPQLFSELTSFL